MLGMSNENTPDKEQVEQGVELNTSMGNEMSGFFHDLKEVPADPIMGIKEAFAADGRPVVTSHGVELGDGKVDLSAGVYKEPDGSVPQFDAAAEMKKEIANSGNSDSYLPLAGLPAFRDQITKLVLGENSAALKEGRVVAIQSAGGGGALRLGAEEIAADRDNPVMAHSNITWPNHNKIFNKAGVTDQHSYRYYDAEKKGLDLDGMLEDLSKLPQGSAVILHVCCHNPTGVDPKKEEWDKIVELFEQRQDLLAFFDFAYQGFAADTETDTYPIRKFEEAGLEFLVAQSASKSFGMYGQRVGTLIAVTNDPERARVLEGRLTSDGIRPLHTHAPKFGAELVAGMLSDDSRRSSWENQLSGMKDRIKEMRTAFNTEMKKHAPDANFDFVEEQNGMFSLLGLSKDQVGKLKDMGVYMPGSGRICFACLNNDNVEYVARAISSIL